MGTLTAGQPKLAEYCDHKLPTSCRLSSIPECCACADERAHAASYSTYIDGIGFVPRGTRWQRYCWFCKEFWENRVRQSGLRPGQTRIPEVPYQDAFLEKWYDFHRGYRVITKEDGTEERVAVLGEDFREVSPGDLPRTLEELRAGRERSALDEQVRNRQWVEAEDDTSAGPGLEDTLDQLFQAASTEDAPQRRAPTNQEPPSTSNAHAQAMVAAGSRNREYQARRVAALRRELHRMRNGIERVISGLRDLGENVPDATEATGRLTNLGQTLDDISGVSSSDEANLAIRSVNNLTTSAALSQIDQSMANMQARVDGAREHVNEARRMRDQAASELDLAEQELRTSRQRLQQLQRDQRTTENYTRTFGTREDMIQQGENYESPIAGMFSRAYGRYRAAEEVRQEERTLRQVLEDEARSSGEAEAQRLADFGDRERDVWGVPRPLRLAQESTSNTAHLMEDARDEVFAGQDLPPGQRENGDAPLEEYYAMLRRQDWTQPRAEPSRPSDRNFPQNMLEAVVSAREEELQQRNSTLRQIAEGYRAAATQQPASPVEPYSSTPEDRRQDLVHLLVHLGNSSLPTGGINLDQSRIDTALRIWHEVTEPSAMMTRLAEPDALGPRYTVANLLGRDDLVWESHLPAARLARIRESGQQVSFSNQPQTFDLEVRRGNVEVMAEAFQMSAELRRTSGMNASEQIRMLNRLQSGRRSEEDRAVLESMLLTPETVSLATRIHREQNSPSGTDSRHQMLLEEERRRAARDGDHSRQGLQAQRATHSFAAAAGRLAMQTGSQALMDRLQLPPADIYRQMGFGPSSPSASGSEADEDDGHKGLDAKDSGRPDPKSDEEMTLKMDCKICFSQFADVACLPCGHLVMCRWCSDQHSPTLSHDHTRPRRAAGCPLCRKGIRQKVKVFRA